jgi:hypothetical protein
MSWTSPTATATATATAAAAVTATVTATATTTATATSCSGVKRPEIQHGCCAVAYCLTQEACEQGVTPLNTVRYGVATAGIPVAPRCRQVISPKLIRISIKASRMAKGGFAESVSGSILALGHPWHASKNGTRPRSLLAQVIARTDVLNAGIYIFLVRLTKYSKLLLS